MNICVGGYDTQAVDKKCTIYYMIRNNRLVACIEMRQSSLFQVKGYSNHHLQPDPAGAAWQWINHNEIHHATQYDLPAIEECINVDRVISDEVEKIIPEEVLVYNGETGERQPRLVQAHARIEAEPEPLPF
jgi:hypothetical protein